MNSKRLMILADRIDGLPYVGWNEAVRERPGFNMGFSHYGCQTPACLAGWARVEFGASPIEALNLTEREFWALAAPENKYADYTARPGDQGFITSQHAAAVLRHAANTGKIDWSVGKAGTS